MALAFGIVVIGCTPQRQYKVLSFFFDGVPDPNAPKVTPVLASMSAEQRTAMKLAVIHKPYADGNCRSCHASLDNVKPGEGSQDVLSTSGKTLKLVAMDSSLCLSCHKDKPGEFKVMHGPVASAACMWCHEPHQSDNAALLKSRSADLCLQCHDRQLLTTEAKEHQNEARACLDCHFGHGGPNSNLLRPKPLAPPAANSATTQPTVALGPPARPDTAASAAAAAEDAP
jgi:predicted CXXCH cytochrome family protein